MGVALETRRLDKLEQAVQKAPEKVATLTYALRVCQKLVISREFRFQVGYTMEHVVFINPHCEYRTIDCSCFI